MKFFASVVSLQLREFDGRFSLGVARAAQSRCLESGNLNQYQVQSGGLSRSNSLKMKKWWGQYH